MSNVKPVPQGCHTLNAFIVVKDAKQAIEFYKKAFNAQETHPACVGPNGKVMHAELRIGDSTLMLADEFPDMGCLAPQSPGASPVTLMMYTDNVDQVWETAVKAGAKVTMPLANQFWGDRFGSLTDPFGHKWSLAQHVEDLTPEQMKERQEKWMKEMAMAGARK